MKRTYLTGDPARPAPIIDSAPGPPGARPGLPDAAVPKQGRRAERAGAAGTAPVTEGLPPYELELPDPG